jgi:PAS domain S-box-containing protein
MKPEIIAKDALVPKRLSKIIVSGNLEDRVRRQTGELKIQKGQLKQGADREKLGADRERHGAHRERQGAEREKQGADRERLGAVREKVAEEQIRVRTKAMDATLDGIFIIDARSADFPVTYANSAFYQLTGYSKSEVIGKNYFLIYGYEVNVRVLEEIKQTLRQGKSFHGEMLNFRKNGEKFWSLLRLAPVRGAGGLITHFVGIKTDITLMKQQDLEIQEQREELLHVTRVGKLAEFVSSLAHEISQPLTAILSYAQAAQRMLNGREPQLKEILDYIISDDQRAVEVIRRLRALLKKSKPVFESIDINLLIHETVTLIMTQITIMHKTIKFDLSEALSPVQGDRIQLQQVLLNLISNSLEAMEECSDSLELLIRTRRSDSAGMILVEVTDSGCGIPVENMEKLFGHFFTSKPDGLGMGLSISRSIVEAHGGRLEARNNSGRGATFYFTLPVKPVLQSGI